MKTLTAHEIHMLLISLNGAEECFNLMPDSYSPVSDLGKQRISAVRNRLLSAALSDVAIEAPDVRGGAERAEMVAVEGLR